MKINGSVEQGIYVVLILALQKNHEPVKSHVMSSVLNVSDSYLKKILRKLVIAGLIDSNASKDGGYTLAKPIRAITALDVYKALDTDNAALAISDMAKQIFDDEEHITAGEQKIRNAFAASSEAFYANLAAFHLSELLKEEFIDVGYYNWQEKL